MMMRKARKTLRRCQGDVKQCWGNAKGCQIMLGIFWEMLGITRKTPKDVRKTFGDDGDIEKMLEICQAMLRKRTRDVKQQEKTIGQC